jgi:hypothetical protein
VKDIRRTIETGSAAVSDENGIRQPAALLQNHQRCPEAV